LAPSGPTEEPIVSRQAGEGRPQGFAREHRLRRRGDYLTAYAQGRRAHGKLTVLFGRRREDDGPWRLGLTVTVKVGKAVRRNRLRRLGREIFRRWGAGLPAGWDFVLNFKHGAATANHAEVKRDLLECLRRLGFDPQAEGETSPSGGAPPQPTDPSERHA
jgi:ribonuclease P protein component